MRIGELIGDEVKRSVLRHQLAFAPDFAITALHFSVSLRINAAKRSGVVGAGSAPTAMMRCLIAASFSAPVIAMFSLATTSGAVPAGAMTPTSRLLRSRAVPIRR